jgi:hypothetical protein
MFLEDFLDTGRILIIDSKFVMDSVRKGEFGVGLKYGFTSNLTGEVVYNPDFSQIETDARG